MRTSFRFLTSCCLVLASTSLCFAEGRTVARVFWQDDTDATVRYGDLKRSAEGWSIQPTPITDFPKLDIDAQSLVQMRSDDGLLLIGVRDDANGELGSGWVAVESGAEEEPHGDHSHWRLNNSPSVLHVNIGVDQGNPAHVYQYGKSFVLANDAKNGFTITSASALRSSESAPDAAKFYDGGNGHITLAVIEDQVAYSTWIARDGDDSGRVDVVGLGDNEGKKYSIQCPSGGLHGATANSGKVFLAPSDGVCWVDADLECDDAPETVDVHYLSLGKDDDDAPLRTGAFENLDQRVVFTAGKGENAKLCWIDASSDSPSIESLPIELSGDESLTTPLAIKSRGGKSLILLFRENRNAPETDELLVIDVDANRDGNWEDAALTHTVDIGRNQIQGHGGHHQALQLPSRRHLLVSNPADGTLSLISLSDWTVQETFSVEGQPARMAAFGE
ncbi:hypothetical protein [Allorhodopirellula solitaria]|uniref:Uncharacterized protein n=1 Tax=Allorhodopirellula solitaria TaxID=2527987 RepID=A0A5C5YFP8_9BACT|nr:hypothetical protein [Allorhodopirellula solitaria]TWT73311.1 hypothetical protein CA85_17800 [Allorhodopirellula solitaria]